MFIRNSRLIYLEHNFSKGRVRIWFFGIDWFQIAAIVKWPLVTRLLGEPLSMRIDISVGYQSPFATVSVEVGLSGGTLRHLKVRAVLVGKKAVEDMIALGACWLPACRCPAHPCS
jgi:hypothetical protein